MKIILLILMTVSGMTANASDCATSFNEVLTRHLEAIDERDLSAYMSTIPQQDSLLMVLPDGSSWNTRQAIEQGHKGWFSDTTWVFDTELIHKSVEDNFGLVAYNVQVNRPDKPGQPFLLSMMFAPDADGCWYLRHDQNTLLPKQPPEE